MCNIHINELLFQQKLFYFYRIKLYLPSAIIISKGRYLRHFGKTFSRRIRFTFSDPFIQFGFQSFTFRLAKRPGRLQTSSASHQFDPPFKFVEHFHA